MLSLNTANAFYASLFLCQILSHARAYAIDASCKPYSTDNQDKTSMITDAMAETRFMTSLASALINSPETGLGNAQQRLFPGATIEDLAQISSMSTIPSSSSSFVDTNIHHFSQLATDTNACLRQIPYSSRQYSLGNYRLPVPIARPADHLLRWRKLHPRTQGRF